MTIVRHGALARAVALVGTLAVGSLPAVVRAAQPPEAVARVKQSVVAVGVFSPTRAPSFTFSGTGFVVGDGHLVATNAHVLPDKLDPARREAIAIGLPSNPGDPPGRVALRIAKVAASDASTDLAVLRVDGPPLPALTLGDSERVGDGQPILLTGFPIGTVLGIYPATHRGVVAATAPIAIPQRSARELRTETIRRLESGTFAVFQLDATAYPGNSGSPVYDPDSGEVLGILNLVLVKGTRESALSAPTGISYAVPSSKLRPLIEQASR